MKYILFGFVVLVGTSRLFGAALLFDAFDYTNGPVTVVSSDKWSSHSGTAGQVDVVSGRLFLTHSETEDVNAPLGTSFAANSSASLYTSLTINLASLPTGAGTFFAHFNTSTFRGRIMATTNDAPAGMYRIGVANGANAASALLTNLFQLNSNYVVVTRYVVNSATTTLWLSPTLESDPSVTASDVASASTVSTFAFRQHFSSPDGIGSIYIDDVTVGTAFADVVPTSPPEIVTQPESRAVVNGTTVSFQATINGRIPFHYQWNFNGTNLPNATNAVLTLSNVTTNHAGSYTLMVSNDFGFSLSQPALLSVETLVPYLSGGLTILTYNVKGNGATNWTTNSTQIQAIGRQLRFLKPDVITFNEIPYQYTDEMTNFVKAFLPGYAMATNSGTDTFIRNVIVSRFPINRSQKWLDGGSLTNFGYSGNFTRDLFEAEIAVPEFIQPVHVFSTHLKATTSSPPDDAAKRGAEASAVSNFFVNTFLPANGNRPYLLTGDMNEDIFRPGGNYVSFQPIQRLANTNTGLELNTPRNPFNNDDRTISIQSSLTVRFDYILPCGLLATNIATNQVFRTDLITPTPSGIQTNDSKLSSDHLPVLMVFNNPYVAVVPPTLVIQQPPTNQTNSLGSTAVFSVSATGTLPLSYQWIKDGTNYLSNGGTISGANSATLNIANVTLNDAGNYAVLVSNSETNSLTPNATLNIVQAPFIMANPVGSTNQIGTSATFTVAVSGSGPLSYQWQFAGTNIPGATSQSYTRTNVQLSDAGGYQVIIGNPAGTVESAIVVLRVAAPNGLWNFNSNPADTNTATGILTASTGTGTAAAIGGTTSSFSSGSGSDPAPVPDNSGWQTASYPAATSANKTAGVHFNVSTLGRENIVITWDQRVSGTASRYYRLQYSTNGSTFIDCAAATEMTNNSVFESKSVSLANAPGVKNNANFAFRIVSEFESTAKLTANATYVGTGSTYGTSGTVRFDMVNVSGIPQLDAPVLSGLQINGGEFSFALSQPQNFPFVLESSTNLLNWIPFATNFNSMLFIEGESADAQRFFRSRGL